MSRHQTTAGLLCFSLLAASLAAAKFVVETHSLRIREPATMTGEFSLAIGDVRATSCLAPYLLPAQPDTSKFFDVQLDCSGTPYAGELLRSVT